MKRILAVVLLALLALATFAVGTFAADPDTKLGQKVAQAIYGTPTVDGNVDEIWNQAQINKIDTVWVDDGLGFLPSAQFRTMWDESYLYMLVEVKDQTMPADESWEAQQPGGNLWRRDGVGFCFAPDYDRSGTAPDPAFWYIIGSYGLTANWKEVPNEVFISENDVKMYQISYQKDANGNLTGYTIECRVNLQPRYNAIKMEAGTLIGFDIMVNDNNNVLFSNGRNNGLYWSNPGQDSDKDNENKGTIQLMDKEVKFDNTTTEAPTTEEPTTEEPTTEAPTVEEPTTEEPTTEEPTTEEPTTEESTTVADDGASTTTGSGSTTEDSGCASTIGGCTAFVLLLSAGGALVLKKKEN